MAHEYATRSNSQVDPALHQLEENIVTSINSLQDEITNLKDIITKKLQNERLRMRRSNLENKLVSSKTLTNALEQYRRRNNFVLCSILEMTYLHCDQFGGLLGLYLRGIFQVILFCYFSKVNLSSCHQCIIEYA